MLVTVHVGMGKTGSSVIQSLLSLNRDVLARSGIAYPNTLPSADEKAKQLRATAGNGLELSQLLMDRGASPQGPKDIVAYVSKFIEPPSVNVEQVLFSSEKLFKPVAASANIINGCRELGFNFRVLCYVRDVVSHAWADYAQVVKVGVEQRSFEEFAQQYRYPFGTIKTLKSSLNASLHSYESVLRLGVGIFEHFVGLLGFSESRNTLQVDGRGVVVNRTLSPARVRFKRFLNGALAEHAQTQEGRRLVSEFGYSLSEETAQSEYYVNSKIHSDFREKYVEQLEALNRDRALETGVLNLLSDRWIVTDQDFGLSERERELHSIENLLEDDQVLLYAGKLRIDLGFMISEYRKWLASQSIKVW